MNRTRVHFSPSPLLLGAILLLLFPNLAVADTHESGRSFDYDTDLDTLSAADILETSRVSPSPRERARLRGYLATRRPDSAEGVTARAWIASREGNDEEAERLYRRALEMEPNLALAWNNLAALLSRQDRHAEQAAIRQEQLDRDPRYGEYEPFVWQYFTYLRRLNDPDAAEAYRQRIAESLGPEHYVHAQIDAILAIGEGEHDEAIRIRREVLLSGDPPFWFRRYAALHRYGRRSTNAQNAGGRLSPLFDLLEWAEKNGTPADRYQALMEVGEAYQKDFDAYADAFRAYRQAFAVYPAVEPAEEAFGFGRSRFGEETVAFLAEVRERLPYSPEAARLEAWNYYNFDFDPPRAAEAARRAIEVSPTPGELRESVEMAARVYEDGLINFDSAYQLLRSQEGAFRSDRERWLTLLYRNRVEGQRFEEAASYLEQLRKTPGVDPQWYEDNWSRVGHLRDAMAHSPDPAEVVLSGSFEPDVMALSPDGKVSAVGFYPMQLWSMERGVKIRDLQRGGSVRLFSPDSRYLATLSNFTLESRRTERALYVYDVEEGTLLFVVPHLSYDLEGLAWSPDSSRILFGDKTGQMRVYHVPSGTPAGAFRPSDVRIAGRLTWLPDNTIVVAQAQAKRLRLFDGDTFDSLGELGGVDWPHTVTHAAEGRYLVATDNRYRLHRWDTDSWNHRSVSIPSFTRRMVGDPEKAIVALNDAGENGLELLLYDVETMERLGEIAGYERIVPRFGGGFLALGSDADVALHTIPELEEFATLRRFAVPGSTMVVERGNGVAIIQDEEGAHFFSLESGDKLRTVPLEGELHDLGDGRLLFLENRRSRFFSTEAFRVTQELDIGVEVDQLAVRNGRVAFGGVFNGVDRGTAEWAKVEVYDIARGELLHAVEFPFATEFLNQGIRDPELTSLDLSPDGTTVVVTTRWRDGFGQAHQQSKEARVYDSRSELVGRVNWGDREIVEAEFSATQGELLVRSGDNRRRYEWKSGRFLRDEGFHSGKGIELSDGRSVYWTSRFFQVEDRPVFTSHFITSVAVDESRNLLLVYTRQNQLILYRLDTTEELLRIQKQRGDNWISVTPSGEYVASEKRLLGANWNLEGTMFPVDYSAAIARNPTGVRRALQAARAGEHRSGAEGRIGDRVLVAYHRGSEITMDLVSADPANLSARVSGIPAGENTLELVLRVNDRIARRVSLRPDGPRAFDFDLSTAVEGSANALIAVDLLVNGVIVQRRFPFSKLELGGLR